MMLSLAHKDDVPIKQIAKDFGIPEFCLRNWLHQADVEDGSRPGVTAAYFAQAHLPGK